MAHHFFGQEQLRDGTVITYFQDKWYSEFDQGNSLCDAQHESDMALRERELTPIFDPNKIDSRKVRKELKDKFVNLGRKVNRIPSTVKRI